MPSIAHAPLIPILALPVCVVGVRVETEQIEEIVFMPPGTTLADNPPPLACRVREAILACLARPDVPFDLPFKARGTAFQRRVWAALLAIPPGQTRTYGEVAESLHSVARAVGQACRSNPFPILVPCHRVIGKQGLGGFAGHTEDWWIKTKQWLLAHEKAL
ncbi:methylated-DNA--[protein]-cysteine S-methyltransferase [Uliginosibacterium gangwonense]|uniref:methylated-DNA--[protein]-cysteine S-methyltransferase n=1 Tax=Uliginosibacterium gangwonense TaxID=392736 RepID=UPI0003694E59|nr:methylated-DNA--[protein]-cysteine S-methyltransferase [Uliginosibacterium gangwonense]